MNEKTFNLVILLSMFGPITSRTILSKSGMQLTGENISKHAVTSEDAHTGKKRTTQCQVDPNVKTDCAFKAANAGHLEHNLNDDLEFFKTCIAQYYCFQKDANSDVWVNVPTFQDLIGTTYFNNAAKRVEIFFIRYNDWSTTMRNENFRHTGTGQCTNLLYIIAARYLYVTYVLNALQSPNPFGPCGISGTKLIVPSNGVCYPPTSGRVTCTTDYDIALVGERSGSLTALFNQFFKEQVGKDPIVPGFGKSSEELFNTNVYAFTMEFAMPFAFEGLSPQFVTEVNVLNTAMTFELQEVVSAIRKMRDYSVSYYNDLHSDHRELTRRQTKHSLFNIFQEWSYKFDRFKNAVRDFVSSEVFTTEINFRRRHNIAYEMIMGIVENHGLSQYTGKALSEISIALMYASDAYHTRGAIRHVVGWTQMNRIEALNATTVDDYWVSMLENWADSNKEYARECRGLDTTACLPKMSKYMWRMFDAMFAAHSKLAPDLRENLIVVDNDQNTGLRSIMSHWLTDIKKKGLTAIPLDDRLPNMPLETNTLDSFLQAFGCNTQMKQNSLNQGCMNKIHNTIRDYNRALFINMVYRDAV